MARVSPASHRAPRRLAFWYFSLWGIALFLCGYSWLTWADYQTARAALNLQQSEMVPPPDRRRESPPSMARAEMIVATPPDEKQLARTALRAREIELLTEESLDAQYGGLFHLLKLDSEHIARVKTLLVKRQSAINDAFRVYLAQNNGAEDPQEWPAVVHPVDVALAPEFKAALGEQGSKIVADYFETGWLRSWTQRTDSLLRADGVALSIEKQEALLTLMAEANPSRTLYPTIPTPTLEAARKILSPTEATAFENIAAEVNGRAAMFSAAQLLLDQR